MSVKEKRHILVVDDNINNLKLAQQTLQPKFKVTTFTSGEEALEFVSANKTDLILLDINMPGMDGFETIRALKTSQETASIPVIFLSSSSNPEQEVIGLKLGAIDFISKPIVPEVMLRRVNLQIELMRYRSELENLVDEKTKIVEKLQDVIMLSISDLVEFRDKITGGHAKRSAEYLKVMLNHLKNKEMYKEHLSAEHITDILRAAPLHDVGKIGITDNILTKTGSLDDDEFEYMKLHTKLGGLAFEKALEELPGNRFLNVASNMALCHHERWNGEGYPYGLSGEDIPFSARLMAIADVYDALTTKRSYKEPISHEKAMELMISKSGIHFQPELINEFIECSDEFYKLNCMFKEDELI